MIERVFFKMHVMYSFEDGWLCVSTSDGLQYVDLHSVRTITVEFGPKCYVFVGCQQRRVEFPYANEAADFADAVRKEIVRLSKIDAVGGGAEQ